MDYPRFLKQLFGIAIPFAVGSTFICISVLGLINSTMDINTALLFITPSVALVAFAVFVGWHLARSKKKPFDPAHWLDEVKRLSGSRYWYTFWVSFALGASVLALSLGGLWQMYQEGIGQEDALYVWIWLIPAVGLLWLSWKMYKIASSRNFPDLQILNDPSSVRWIYAYTLNFNFVDTNQVIYLCTNKGKMYGIPYSRDSRDAIMQGLTALAPQAVVGYSAERLKQFKKDPNNMV
jgi:hypothetical protein